MEGHFLNSSVTLHDFNCKLNLSVNHCSVNKHPSDWREIFNHSNKLPFFLIRNNKSGTVIIISHWKTLILIGINGTWIIRLKKVIIYSFSWDLRMVVAMLRWWIYSNSHIAKLLMHFSYCVIYVAYSWWEMSRCSSHWMHDCIHPPHLLSCLLW